MAAGDPIFWEDVQEARDASADKPLVRLVQTAAQALADATQVAVTFTSEEIDTHGFHDSGTNTSRITPTVAGYYRFSGTAFFEAQSTPVVSDVNIRKNGATNIAPAGRYLGAGQTFALACTAIVSMNGTTDYVELVARQDSVGADNTNVSLQFSSVFECEYLRPL